MTRRRAIGLGGGLAAVIAILVLAFGGRGDTHQVPEGGSAFGAAASTTHPRPGTGLIDALAPVLEQGQGGATAAGATPGLPVDGPRAAARLLLVGFAGTRATHSLLTRLTAHEWGGIVLDRGNGVAPQQVAGLVRGIRGAALRARHPAPLVAAVQPGGDADAVPIGDPVAAATAGGAAGARRTALAAARALRQVGVRMVLGPPADLGVAGGAWEGRAFSDQPSAVTALAAAATAGYGLGGVAPAPGHFPGEGAASGDPSLQPATVGSSLADLRRADLQPFRALVRQAPAIQLSSATYVAFDGVTPATVLPGVVRLLRHELGFGGVIVSGDLAGASLATGQPVADLAVEALKAGCDLLWIPGDAADQDAAWRAIVRGLRTGEIPPARVAGALTRVSILRAGYGVR